MSLARLFFVSLVIIACPSGAPAQALKIVEKLASNAARSVGRQLGKGTASIVFTESDEALKILARRTASFPSDDVFMTRFSRLSGVDDTLRAEFRALKPAEKRLVVELGEGVQLALRRYPDDGLALIQKLDAGGLAQARTYGDFVVDGAHWLQTDDVAKALGAVKLGPEEATALSRTLALKSLPNTLQPEHLIPLWKSVIRKMGKGAGVFWKTYIAPHKAKWLVAGLLATYLIMPEKFHDAIGNLTEYALRQLAELGIAASSGAVQGTVGGLVDAIKARYADDPATTTLVTVFVILMLLLAVPWVRRWICLGLLGAIRRGSDVSTKQESEFRRQHPFRE
ncbi:MAG: hypothetical protein NZ700_04520 [Gemmataceae bacterium]|nr:hypothetical protein [Gemmataceae bacterium]MDW8266485.1 hypothetical protein [Gemmataceae bacterium]